MGVSKHIFDDCEVICTPLQQTGGAKPYYCRVYRNGKQVLAVTIPEADTTSEAARIARSFIFDGDAKEGRK